MTGSISQYQTRRAQHAFERAIATYQERMTSEEFRRLQEVSSLGHLVEQSQAIYEVLQLKTTSKSQSKVSKLAFNLAPFQRLLEGVCKLSPMGGDLLWGSISFILETAKDNSDVLEEVMEFFMTMVDEIKYLQVIEDTFEESDIVIPALEAIYIAILEFWMKAMAYYRNKMRKGKNQIHTSWLSSVEADRNTKDIISRSKSWLASSSKMIDEFVKLKEKIRAQKTRLHEVAAAQYQADDKEHRQRRQQETFFKWIDAPHYEHDFRAANEHRHDGSCEWLRKRPEYIDWVEGQTNGLLVIYGTAGVGKTILTSWLINEAQSHSVGHAALYHFFKEVDDSKNTAVAATRSLLDQIYDIILSTDHPLIATLESDLRHISRRRHVNFEQLWNTLSSVLLQCCQLEKPGPPFAMTVVLDAVDECKDSKTLVRSLRQLVHATSSRVRVVVTARPSGNHVDEFRCSHADQSLPTTLLLTENDVQDDIATFIAHHVSQIERIGGPKHRSLRERIIAVFSDVRNHQGMFLWAYLMCKEVECQLRTSDIWRLLEHLPMGLYATYARICERLAASNERNHEFGRRVLQWIVASRRPMTFAELEEALRMPTGSDDSPESDFFDENGGLLWSRRDIVISCGDLVRYTGLTEGDTIGIVHLSARQFLSTHPSELSPQFPSSMLDAVGSFLVDVQSTELKIALSCMKYILSTQVHSEEYSLPIQLKSARTPGQDAFKSRYPLFDYSTIYWTDYTFDVIESQPYADIARLLETLTEFIHSSTALVWLEELIRLTFIEFAQHTIRRFTLLNNTSVYNDVLRWSHIVMEALLRYSPEVSLRPQLIRLCISQLQSMAPCDPKSIDIPPLDADLSRRWIHYDPAADVLLSIAGLDQQFLRCQFLKTGIRLQPLLLELPKRTQEESFVFRSAIVNVSSRCVAITFRHETRSHPGYLTMCWDISNLTATSSIDKWATPTFNSYAVDERDMFFRHGVVAFGRNDTVITPGGIFNTVTMELVDRPSAIYDPHPTLRITDTYFSGQGERVARVNSNALEVLDINGMVLCKHRFVGSSYIKLRGFSDTGSKAIIFVDGERPGLSCFVTNEAKQIQLPLPHSQWYLRQSAFTKDEGKFLASVLDLQNPPNHQLAVWTFVLDEDGSYRDHADMVFVFEHVGLYFDLAEPSEDSTENALVVDADGRVIKRPLDLQWAPSRPVSVWSSWIVTRKSPLPEFILWSLQHKALTVETWSLERAQPELIGVSHTEEPVLTSPPEVSALSPDGRYLAVDEAILDAHTSNGVGVCELRLHGKMAGAAFSIDGDLLASVHEENGLSTLYVFEVSQGPRISQRALFDFDRTLDHKLFFSERDPSLLAVDDYVMRLEGRNLIVQAKIRKNIAGFSACGSYYFTLPLELHRLADNPETSMSAQLIRHPLFMEPNIPYVFSPHMLKLERVGGVMILKHRNIHEDDNSACRSRIICVIPEGTHLVLDDFTLVWPEKDNETLKLLIVKKEEPKLFGVGITKGALMNTVGWFDGLRFDD